MDPPRQGRSLRALLFAHFGGVVLTAVAVASLMVAFWRLPVAREQMQNDQQRIADLALQQLEITLDNTESLVRALAGAADERQATPAVRAASGARGADARSPLDSLFERVTASGALVDALYLVDAGSRIVALGRPHGLTVDAGEWKGFDLSGLPVIREAWAANAPRWSEQQVSPVQGLPVVIVAVPTRGGALVAEVSVQRLGQLAAQAGRMDGLLVLVLDPKGEIIAGPDMDSARQRINVSNLEPVRHALQRRAGFHIFDFAGQRYNGTTVRSQRLGWWLLVAYPMNVYNASRNAALLITGATMLLSLGLGLYTLHRLSRRLSRRLDQSVNFARAVADGRYDQRMEPTSVRELEALNTELQRMTASIRRRERHLRAIIDNTPSLAIQLYDLDSRVVDWNPSSEALLGHTRAQALGRTPGELVCSAEQQAAFAKVLAAIAAGGKPRGPYEVAITRGDGRHRVLLATTFAIHGPEEDPLFVSMQIDISPMKRQEAALRANEAKFATFFHANPVALAVLRRHAGEFEYLDVNAAWEALVGYRREGVVNRVLGPRVGFSIFALADERRRFVERVASEQHYAGFEFSLRTAAGEIKLAELTLGVVDVGGEQLIVYSVQDVTDKRALARQLRELNAELEDRIAQRTSSLAQANAELQRTLDELRRTQDRLIQSEKLSSLGSLVAGVAHELNTPLGNGLMAVTTLQERLRALQQQVARGLRRSEFDAFVLDVDEGCRIAERNLARASTLLQSFKRIAVDQSSEARREFELDALIDEILLTLRPTLRNRPIEVRRELQPGLRMDSHPGALAQVLTNLVQNAVLHGLDGLPEGVLTVRTRRGEAGHVVVEVADNGHGIAPEARHRVFDPFFTTRMGQGGSGLGLSIARSVVTGALGGEIELHSEPGQGTVFRLTLPLSAPQRAVSALPEASAAVAAPVAADPAAASVSPLTPAA